MPLLITAVFAKSSKESKDDMILSRAFSAAARAVWNFMGEVGRHASSRPVRLVVFSSSSVVGMRIEIRAEGVRGDNSRGMGLKTGS